MSTSTGKAEQREDYDAVISGVDLSAERVPTRKAERAGRNPMALRSGYAPSRPPFFSRYDREDAYAQEHASGIRVGAFAAPSASGEGHIISSLG